MSVEIVNLRKEFDTTSGTVTAVDELSLEIKQGEFVSLVGPSGCGKTTTLRCVAGLDTPSSGQIVIDGEDMTTVPANKRGISMMFQNIALFPHMTIQDNISYPLKVKGVSKEQRYDEAARAAEIMQIGDLVEMYPGQLSGGQQQRSALARTLVQQPKAFLLDEPLSDLDAQLKVVMRKEIQRVHRKVGKPTLYVTHDQEEALTMSDRIAVMNDGEIEQIGSPDELYDEPANTFIAQFIGSPEMNLLDGVLDSSDGQGTTLSIPEANLELRVESTVAPDERLDVEAGFRPEDVTFRDPGDQTTLEMDVTLLERIGDRLQATGPSPCGEIRVVVPADTSIVEGETAYLDFSESRLHFFEQETGDAVGRGTIVHDRRVDRENA